VERHLARKKHFHNWGKGYWARCEKCDSVVEGDVEEREPGEPCPKCGTMMFAYGYGGTARWCPKCMKWYHATIPQKLTPEEEYAEMMWM